MRTRPATTRSITPARRTSPRARWRAWALVVLLAPLVFAADPSAADPYDKDRAGHPLRVLAYVVHPVGVALDYLIFRPAHWLGHHEPLRTLFGHETE
jgi:hypothetical protein